MGMLYRYVQTQDDHLLSILHFKNMWISYSYRFAYISLLSYLNYFNQSQKADTQILVYNLMDSTEKPISAALLVL